MTIVQTDTDEFIIEEIDHYLRSLDSKRINGEIDFGLIDSEWIDCIPCGYIWDGKINNFYNTKYIKLSIRYRLKQLGEIDDPIYGRSYAPIPFIDITSSRYFIDIKRSNQWYNVGFDVSEKPGPTLNKFCRHMMYILEELERF
jgi:hypothetical protein